MKIITLLFPFILKSLTGFNSLEGIEINSNNEVLNNSDIVYIPDANFKAALVNNVRFINTNGDNEIQVSEANSYAGNISVSFENISDLTGIEYFTKITQLYCVNNNLVSLDVSANTSLILLDCGQNDITSLDVSTNTNLEILRTSHNPLRTLNISKNLSLTKLECANNMLSNLDISKNTNLRTLAFIINELNTIDISNNTSLRILEGHSNQLKSIDLSNNILLRDINLGYNVLETIDLSNNILLEDINLENNVLETIDLSNNILLEDINLKSNQLETIDLRNGHNRSISLPDYQLPDYEFHQNPNLSCIYVDDSAYSNRWWNSFKEARNKFVETEEECSNLLSIDNFQLINFKIYPNPTSKILNINIPLKKATIYNVQGKELLKSNSQNINIEILSKGLYLIRLEDESNNVFSARFMKN